MMCTKECTIQFMEKARLPNGSYHAKNITYSRLILAKKINYNKGDLVGSFGIEFYSDAERTTTRNCMFKCCNCKRVFKSALLNIRNDRVKSCGCMRPELNRIASTKHGKSGHPLYLVWRGMLNRVDLKTCKEYKFYGSRGIKVCSEWRDFKTFYSWCLNNGWKKGLHIDRIDNNLDYSEANCRFVTSKVNMQNTRNSYVWTVNGIDFNSAYDAAESVGVSTMTILNRIKKGCDGYSKRKLYQ